MIQEARRKIGWDLKEIPEKRGDLPESLVKLKENLVFFTTPEKEENYYVLEIYYI